MRDYVEIIAQLRRDGQETAADAMQELHTMARRMTTLGADLEEQIQEDLTADYYAVGLDTQSNPLTLLLRPEVLRGLPLPYQLPMKYTALKVIGESWIVRLGEDEEPTEFYSREALDEAVADLTREEEAMPFT